MLGIIFLTSCKEGYLEAKPDLSLVVPHTVKEFQALLDNTAIINSHTPFLAEVGAGDNDLQPNRHQTLQVKERNAFIWAKDIYENQIVEDWDWSYRRVFYANQALGGLEDMEDGQKNRADYKQAKGSAFFIRGWTFYQLAQQFCKPYIPASASSDLGIPLRTESNINIKTTRATVQQTYDQIISDAMNAARYLPATVTVKTRPSRQAAFALLSTTFLQMQDYTKAKLYADSCLAISAELTDYNTVKPAGAFSFKQFSPEVIFHSNTLYGIAFIESNFTLNKSLYDQYASNDLRKTLFYKDTKGIITFVGSYTGAREFFSGYAIDEMYLILAECFARKSDKVQALHYLNMLLKTRWKTGSYTPLTAASDEDALKLVLAERRKELVFRGRRWSDLRRLNQDSRFAVTLTRTVGTNAYNLVPNSPLYVLPIPPNVINLTGIEQNLR